MTDGLRKAGIIKQNGARKSKDLNVYVRNIKRLAEHGLVFRGKGEEKTMVGIIILAVYCWIGVFFDSYL